MLPRAILFDLDDTILQVAGGPEAAWHAVADEFAHELDPVPTAEFAATVLALSRDFWGDAARHRHWRMRLLDARREIVARALARVGRESRPDLGRRLADRFSAYRDEQLCLFPDAHEVIDVLKARGVLLGLITNGAAEPQRAKITRFALVHRFDHIQIEGEHEFGKPDERAYRHALATLGVEPRDTWMIGDNLEWEVIAPQRLGIHAIWFDGTGRGLPSDSPVKPDRIVRRLKELLPGE